MASCRHWFLRAVSWRCLLRGIMSNTSSLIRPGGMQARPQTAQVKRRMKLSERQMKLLKRWMKLVWSQATMQLFHILLGQPCWKPPPPSFWPPGLLACDCLPMRVSLFSIHCLLFFLVWLLLHRSTSQTNDPDCCIPTTLNIAVKTLPNSTQNKKCAISSLHFEDLWMVWSALKFVPTTTYSCCTVRACPLQHLVLPALQTLVRTLPVNFSVLNMLPLHPTITHRFSPLQISHGTSNTSDDPYAMLHSRSDV